MEFTIKSRREAVYENGVHDPHIIISIFTPGDEPPQVCQNQYTKQVVQFAFDDLDRTPGPATRLALGHPVIFGDLEAKKIIDIVEFWKDKGIDHIICHCDAGISRSAGVASALSKYYNGTDNEFFNSAKYRPNMLVYRTILDAFYRT